MTMEVLPFSGWNESFFGDLHGQGRHGIEFFRTETGALTVTSTPQPRQPPNARMRYVISGTRVASTDPFLFHKTTRRELYDREWQHYNETLGADEVLYLNERGELAEGSRTTIFVERDGRLLTPPLASGLLPGTLRAELLATGRAHEAVLTRADLEQADVAYLGNSVRGLLRAEPLRSHAAEATGALGSAP